MKIRWKEHEMIVVAILIVWQIITLLLNVYNQSPEKLASDFVTQFKEHGVPFNYWRNALIPQISSLLLILTVYLLVNLVVVPLFKQIRGEDIERLFSMRLVKAISSLLFVGFLLAIGINIISFYGRPHLFNYRDYQWFAIAGYNDKPLDDLFFGFGGALAAVAVVTVIAGIRDLIIWSIERNSFRRDYRVMIINNATPLLAMYVCALVIIKPMNGDFLKYLVFVLPLIGLYLYFTFWLFPYKGDKTFGHQPVFIRLLLSTFICIVPSLLLSVGHSEPFIPVLYWMFLLFIFTPLIWIVYQQRSDKIIQLKSMETALARSSADLQFLKSQINPHFLFNALNTLYGTALKGESDKTAVGIQKLGDMMRFMLHENTLDLIPIEKEVEYLTNFIALHELRIQSSPDIRIEENIEMVSSGYEIAPMLLIPFVENAFKHGISLKSKSWIKINLSSNGNILNFEISNSIHQNEKALEHGKSGIGLTNVRERLKLQYPDKHLLNIAETENEFNVKLVLQC